MEDVWIKQHRNILDIEIYESLSHLKYLNENEQIYLHLKFLYGINYWDNYFEYTVSDKFKKEKKYLYIQENLNKNIIINDCYIVRVKRSHQIFVIDKILYNTTLKKELGDIE